MAVVGENGAGKSTLMKILAGAIQPDAGRSGSTASRWRSPTPTRRSASASASSTRNSAWSTPRASARTSFSATCRAGPGSRRRSTGRGSGGDADELLERVGAHVSPQTPVRPLSVAQKQMVEIARALASNARVLILDEPTSSLTAQETATLFGIVDGAEARGVGIIYISHRLEEVFASPTG